MVKTAMSSSPLHDTAPPALHLSLAAIVEHNRLGHPDGPEELYRLLYALKRPLGKIFGFQQFDDSLHDLFLIMVNAIQSGRIENPGALICYALNTAKRMVLSRINERQRHERLTPYARIDFQMRMPAPNAERDLLDAERRKQLDKWMRALSERDREILTRFYLNNEPAEQIQAEMRIDATKYRLAKSRAKQRLQYLALKSEGQSHAYSGSASIPLALRLARAKSKS